MFFECVSGSEGIYCCGRCYYICTFFLEPSAKLFSIKDILNFHNLEIGYEILEYVISRVTKDVHWLHFFTAVIISSGVSRFSRSFGKLNSFVLSMFVFMCMYFKQSLNIVRQWLAIAIYAGWGYFSNNNYSKLLYL